MKKALVLVLILGLFVGVLAVAGCGEKKKTVETPFGDVTIDEESGDVSVGEGDVDISEDEGEVTIETDEGEVTYKGGEGEPSEEDLGVPIYPDAEYVEGSGGSGSASGSEGTTVYAGGEWTTDDDFDEVVGWYTDKLGDPDMTTSEGGVDTAIWMEGDMSTDITTVTVSNEDGEVKIAIGRIAG